MATKLKEIAINKRPQQLKQWLAEATRQAQDVGKAYENLSAFYFTCAWLQSARSKFQQLAAENPDNPWPLLKLARFDNVQHVISKRQITITLQANQFSVQTEAELDQFSTEMRQYLAQDNPAVIAQHLVWGRTRLSPGDRYVSPMTRQP